MREAFAVARSGRPGPVLIDILKNVTAAGDGGITTPLPREEHAALRAAWAALIRRASHAD